MNYIVYGKKIGARCYGAMNLHEGKVGVGLLYATPVSYTHLTLPTKA